MRTLLVVTLTALSGCATFGTNSYSNSRPDLITIENELSVPMPFEETWDKLVEELVKKFYVINNIDKESRLINMSFSSETPEDYITGGVSTRRFEDGKIVENYIYDPAASVSYKYATTWGQNLPATASMVRTTSLDCRANIYVAPEGDGTKITVNCRYVLTISTSGTYLAKDSYGTVVSSGTIPQTTARVALNTNEPTSSNWADGDPYTFRATGKFENDILSILR